MSLSLFTRRSSADDHAPSPRAPLDDLLLGLARAVAALAAISASFTTTVELDPIALARDAVAFAAADLRAVVTQARGRARRRAAGAGRERGSDGRGRRRRVVG